MVRCSECKKNIVESTKYMDWLALYNFLEFLFSEDYIEKETFESMTDRLMTLKFYAFNSDDPVMMKKEISEIIGKADAISQTLEDDIIDTIDRYL